ncbi:phosphatase PAP2 family protein [uncultured Algibacter sp.]|uniref:phosphatase PAP2 family protein n=1 Tax=uncultured Algibacter sp. TaxID=298659 RepID=UPI00321632AD
MDGTKISLKKKITFTIITSILFGIIYNFNAWYASTLAYVPSFVFSFEKRIPFIPLTVIPYLTSGLFFVSVFFCCKNNTQLVTLFKRMALIIIVAGVCYILFPLKFSLTKPDTNNLLFQFLFQFIKNTDSPYNEAPSLHIAFAFVFWTVFKELRKKWRNLFAIWFLLLGLSTLTTYQHHVIDILTGAILAQISFIVFPSQQNNFQSRNFHIANYYFTGGWIIILLSLVLNEFFYSVYLILFWPSLVLFLIGYNYQKNNVRFLKDRFGNIPLYKKAIYFPYLVTYWFLWRFLRKNSTTIEIIPKIYISSRLDKEEIKSFNFNKNTWVYDFSAELEENAIVVKNSQYFSAPILDIGAFNVIEIKKIVSEISEIYKQLPSDGKILIHCTMGFTRSTFIGILATQKILCLPIGEAITKIKNTHKNAVIPNYLQEFLKTFII